MFINTVIKDSRTMTTLCCNSVTIRSNKLLTWLKSASNNRNGSTPLSLVTISAKQQTSYYRLLDWLPFKFSIVEQLCKSYFKFQDANMSLLKIVIRSKPLQQYIGWNSSHICKIMLKYKINYTTT